MIGVIGGNAADDEAVDIEEANDCLSLMNGLDFLNLECVHGIEDAVDGKDVDAVDLLEFTGEEIAEAKAVGGGCAGSIGEGGDCPGFVGGIGAKEIGVDDLAVGASGEDEKGQGCDDGAWQDGAGVAPRFFRRGGWRTLEDGDKGCHGVVPNLAEFHRRVLRELPAGVSQFEIPLRDSRSREVF